MNKNWREEVDQETVTLLEVVVDFLVHHFGYNKETAFKKIERYLLYELDGENKQPCCCFRLDAQWFYCDNAVVGNPLRKKRIEKIVKNRK